MPGGRARHDFCTAQRCQGKVLRSPAPSSYRLPLSDTSTPRHSPLRACAGLPLGLLPAAALAAQISEVKADGKDKATFQRLLEEVAAFDLQSAPELIPENTIEKKKAAELLEEMFVYFPEE